MSAHADTQSVCGRHGRGSARGVQEQREKQLYLRQGIRRQETFRSGENKKRNRALISLSFVMLLVALLYFLVRDRFFAEKPEPAPMAAVPVRQERERHDVSFFIANALDVFLSQDADVSYIEYTQEKKPQVTVLPLL